MGWRQLLPYSDDELFANEVETLKIAGDSKILDSEVVSEMFKKVKEKGILKEPIGVMIGKSNVIKVPEMEINDYIDQLIYYRKLRGYTQDQVGQVIGVSGKVYYKYEKRINKFKDREKIEAIANFLGIEEKLKMPPPNHKIDYQELRMFLRQNDITNTAFSKEIGVSRRSIIDWINKGTNISEESYIKIEEIIRKLNKNNKIEEEEME